LRAVRFDFLRSSLLSFFVFAMSAVYFSLSDSRSGAELCSAEPPRAAVPT
jgi:hypothetical protein